MGINKKIYEFRMGKIAPKGKENDSDYWIKRMIKLENKEEKRLKEEAKEAIQE